jgi:Xaa-Pro aminopeptidase
MKTEFSAEFFRQNRERLRALFTGTAPIVLTANGLLQRNGDVTYPFRQDSSFWYLTGINEPDVILVLDKYKEFLIVPDRDDTRTAFDGSVDIAKLSQISGVKDVLEHKEGWGKLARRLKKVRHVATLSPSPSYEERNGIYTNPARAQLVTRIKAEASEELELLDLRTHLRRMRSIKQPAELKAIQEAIDLTADAIKKIYRKAEKYDYEYEVEADLTAMFRSHGVDHAFQPIIAGGVNACTLHRVANDSAINKDDLLLLDVGAEVSHYAADISRTFAIRELTKRQRAVLDAVVEVQEFAMSELRPGVLLKDYEVKVAQFMGEKLRELGLIKLIEKEEVRKYYPHATSHFLGLDTHDVGDYERPLEPGMVLTVEPGIYIPEEGIGIRIEDDVLMTEEGIKVLSEKLPQTLS